MFRLGDLPPITFCQAGSEEVLSLAKSGAAVAEVAERVGALCQPGATVGLLFPSGARLVLAWLGVVASGRVPIILQFPNAKMSGQYWKQSIADTVTRCEIAALLYGPELPEPPPEGPRSLLLENMAAGAPVGDEVSFPAEGGILQLSSGTTGFKKAIRFSFADLRSHAEAYNQVLGLTPQDRIVSWLPLYHDMGFIACFVMPLLLGVPIVMLDPMTWVREPELLYRAIARHHGTVCYMPNFGFEVMAKLGHRGPFPSMRHWISCSEPTYPGTLERFLAATGADGATLSTCYGMAENVFAVAQSAGVRLAQHDGRTVVSCGKAIPGTDVKERDGELHVRSAHSVRSYVGGESIRDAEGYYPTGDLGFLTAEGDVVVTGRKRDLANIGGRKYLLNDWDFALGQLFPAFAGRIASLAQFDEASGTEKALFLIEAPNFWEWNRSPAPVSLVREALQLEWLELHFVPPQFITKTSSGKINRPRTLADWLACQGAERGWEPRAKSALAQRLADAFPGIAWDRPADEQLDSLGQLLVRVAAEEHGVAYNAGQSLDELAAGSERETEPAAEVFSIIALIDGARLGLDPDQCPIDAELLDAIAKVVGAPVHFEHIAVPPAPILLSDLFFHDYFLPRDASLRAETFSSMIAKIKGASLILVDDEDNYRLPQFCAYPVLSHRLEASPDAELLGHRMQRYAMDHHALPRKVLLGRDLKLESVNPALERLEGYLDVPIFRMAFHAPYRAYTANWHFQHYAEPNGDAGKAGERSWVEGFRTQLFAFLAEHAGKLRKRLGEGRNRTVLLDPPHFCTFLLNPVAIDFVTRIYDSFSIVGSPSSIPYLRKRLDTLGKPYSYAAQAEPEDAEAECILLTGGIGGRMPATTKPTYDLVHSRGDGEGGGRPHNVPPEIAHACPPFAACDEGMFRSLRGTHGVLIGNYLLNNTPRAEPAAAAAPQG